jgi:hypothetical protein
MAFAVTPLDTQEDKFRKFVDVGHRIYRKVNINLCLHDLTLPSLRSL